MAKGQKPKVQFTKGNQEWKLRNKHGRDKLFASPQLMWEAAEEYFQWCIDNPLMESQAFSFQGTTKLTEVPKMRPMTLQGLCLYMGASSSYFRTFKTERGEKYPDFVAVIQAIEETIENQQYTGAAAGFLNPRIVAMKLGMTEKIQNEISLPEQITGMIIK